MAYIELHQALFDHRKTITAANYIGIPEVHLVGHLAALWCWSLDNCPDGLLPEITRVLTRGAKYDGDGEIFVRALVIAGFIDQIGDELWIHDWQDYGGKLIEKRRTNADKQDRYRERQRVNTTRNQNVTETLPSRDALEKSREEKTRVEKSITPPTPSKPKQAKPILTILPHDFCVTDEMRKWAWEKKGLNDVEIDERTEHFLNYVAKVGKQYVNWVAAWRDSMGWEPRSSLMTNHGRASPNGRPRRGMTNEEILAYGRGEYDDQRSDDETVIDTTGRVVK